MKTLIRPEADRDLDGIFEWYATIHARRWK